MNPFQRARSEAWAVRKKLSGDHGRPISAKELLGRVEEELGLGIESVAPGYADLGGGSAVLQRDQRFIYVSSEFAEWGDQYCGLVAHEIGHWFLDPVGESTSIATASALLEGEGSPGTVKVEAYGARERQELQANVFARELLLPRSEARLLVENGTTPSLAAKELGIPLEFARQQMLDALLLPEVEESRAETKPPSPDQAAAAMAAERFANVIAGPGTGKTSTLVHRVRYLVDQVGVDPSRILVLTFTNKAAAELIERLRAAGIKRAAELWAGTFHAFGLEFLRKYHQRFNLDPEINVADRLASITTLAAGLPSLDLQYYLRVQDPYDWLGPIVEAIKRLKEELVTPDLYRQRIASLDDADDELMRKRMDLAALYEAHETLLAGNKVVDFVDLIAKPAVAIKGDRAIYADLADRFDHILVDEYQDVTHAMVELLRQLAVNAKSLWVVGDVRQAIHHWRGASLHSILRFESAFKAQAGGAKVGRYVLDTNRRSHQEILDVVQHVGRHHALQARLPLDETLASKGLCGERPTVVTCVERAGVLPAIAHGVRSRLALGVPLKNQVVLCRSSGDVRQAAEFLEENSVPVIYVGELAQRPDIKKILCMMQLLVERQPRALVGLMTTPGYAMPLNDITLLLRVTEDDVAYQRGRWIHDPPDGLSPAAIDAIGRLRETVGKFNHNTNPWDFVCELILTHRFGLPDGSEEKVKGAVTRIALWQFAYGVRNGDGDMKQARLSRYLLRQRLRQRIGDTYVDRELPPEASALDGLRVQTVHSSKGLEYDAVHVGFVSADSYGDRSPSWTSPDSILDVVPPAVLGSSDAEYAYEAAVERNNLLYVALSRARRHLWIYQENEYGDKTLAPQLGLPPKPFEEQVYRGVQNAQTIVPATGQFTPPDRITFERFSTFALCHLQFWYADCLGLRREQDIDASVRARLAAMRALRAVAIGSPGAPQVHLDSAWLEARLPTPAEDPTLYRDATKAFLRGATLISRLQGAGGQFVEPITVVGGLEIQLPWGFTNKSRYSTHFDMIRFARNRIEETKTLLRPMVLGLPFPGSKTMSIHSVMSDAVDKVEGSKRIESTKAFKAAVRLLDGDNHPIKGRHCGRCPYMTVCPSAPALPGSVSLR